MATPQTATPLLRAQMYRIWAGSLGLLVVLAAIFASYVVWDYRTQYGAGRGEAEEIADMAAINAEGMLLAVEQLLVGIAAIAEQAPAAQQPHSPEIRRTLMAWKGGLPNMLELLIVEPPGRIVHWTGAGEPPDISDREYVRHHLERQESGIYIGEPQVSKVNPAQWFVGVSKALRGANGEVRRVAAAAINLEVFGNSLTLRFSTPGSSLAIASADGHVYARVPDNALYIGKQMVLPKEAAAFPPGTRSGVFTARSPLDGRKRIVAFRHVKGTTLYAAGSISVDALMEPWRMRVALVCVLWVALAAAALLLAGRLADAAREHDWLAAVDGLTGVLNRRSLLGAAASAERRETCGEEQVAMLIDVDHFKEINDTYGHAVGDDVLRQVAAALRACCRQSDLVGRYGGEEFLVILDRTRLADALVLAESMRYSVASISTPRGSVSVSIGIAEIGEDGGTLDEAILRADAAMYEAKAAGRNCVRVAGAAATAAPASPAPSAG